MQRQRHANLKKKPNFAAYRHGVIGLVRTANIPTEAIAAHIIYNL